MKTSYTEHIQDFQEHIRRLLLLSGVLLAGIEIRNGFEKVDNKN